MRYWLVMPAAGGGQRFGGGVPKQFAALAGRSVIEWALAPFLADDRCSGIAVALAQHDCRFAQLPVAQHPRLHAVIGGSERSDSVRLALASLPALPSEWVLVHDAARPCVSREEIDALLAAGMQDAGGVLAVPVADTLKQSDGYGLVEATAQRAGLWRALTPQMFRVGLLRDALSQAAEAGRVPTDESQAVEWLGHRPRLVRGSARNIKITEPADLALAEVMLRQGSTTMTYRVGSGFDVHAFGPGDGVKLGGVRVPCVRGVVAHSDGDVLLHALCDALLGAGGLGDLGQHFPDSDPHWRGADSGQFITFAVQELARGGWQVVNADLTLLAEVPRIAQFRAGITANVARLLGVEPDCVNVKATTTEQLGFVGRSEGLAAQAVVLIARPPKQ